MKSLRFFNSARTQGCRIGLLSSASGRAGCLPVARKSSLLIRGCAGSTPTGPGPLGGAKKSAPLETQPVPLSGAKFGTLRSSAADAGDSAAIAQALSARQQPAMRFLALSADELFAIANSPQTPRCFPPEAIALGRPDPCR